MKKFTVEIPEEGERNAEEDLKKIFEKAISYYFRLRNKSDPDKALEAWEEELRTEQVKFCDRKIREIEIIKNTIKLVKE